MSTQQDTQALYTDTRLNPGDQEKLQKFRIGETLGAAFNLIREDFLHSFLFPYLWKFLFQILLNIVAFIVMISLFFTTLSVVFSSDYSPGNLTLEDLGQISFTFLLSFVVVILFMSAIIYFINHYLNLRHLYLLNHRRSRGLIELKNTRTNILKATFKSFVASIVVWIAKFAGWLVSLLVIARGVMNLVNFFINQENAVDRTDFYNFIENWEVTRALQVSEWLTESGSSFGVGISLVIIGMFLPFILSSIIEGFVGLRSQLILHEDQGILESLKNSIKISKRHYWKNAVRWFLVFLLLWVIVLFQGVLEWLVNSNNSVSPVQAISVVVFLFIIRILVNFITDIINIAFKYVAFYNFRADSLESERR